MRTPKIAALAIAVVVLGVSACGDDGTASTRTQTVAAESDVTCFQEPTAEELADLADDIVEGEQADPAEGEVPDSVCVFDETTSDLHYYAEPADNSNFWLYVLMYQRYRQVAAYGYIMSDGSDDGLALAMLYLMAFDDDGRAYHPYVKSGNGFARQKQYVGNVRARNVYFGTSQSAKPFDQARSKPAAGYRNNPLPRSNDQIVEVSSGTGGSHTTTKKPGSAASAGRITTAPTTSTSSATRTSSSSPAPSTRASSSSSASSSRASSTASRTQSQAPRTQSNTGSGSRGGSAKPPGRR